MTGKQELKKLVNELDPEDVDEALTRQRLLDRLKQEIKDMTERHKRDKKLSD